MDINKVKYSQLTATEGENLAPVLTELEIDFGRLCEFLKFPHNLVFVAKIGNEICGFIYGYSLMSLDSPPQLFVYSVDVLEKYQNLGIGTKLFQYVVDFSRENGFAECYVMTDKANKRACRIYEKAGGKNDYDDEIIYVVKHERNL
ncbi:MAG: GNAT family N-acetyltransferase [Defluviitaleaceae bacterium]|nr:GNAT family N-acetyltransferase [Defluviitaleaceae bacterium]